jgi:hypothetical protein
VRGVERFCCNTGYPSRYIKLLESDDRVFLDEAIAAIERGVRTSDAKFLTACPLDDVTTVSDVEIDSSFVPTPITYYSGRDGFRNNLLTTSAPLLSVSGCNSVQWNLGTITHELSHRIVAGKLEAAYRDICDWAEQTSRSAMADKPLSKAKRLILPHYATSSEQPVITTGRQLVCFLVARTLLGLHALEFDMEDWKKMKVSNLEEFYIEAYEMYSEDIEEFVVHLFDFYHFYSMDANTYVT